MTSCKRCISRVSNERYTTLPRTVGPLRAWRDGSTRTEDVVYVVSASGVKIIKSYSVNRGVNARRIRKIGLGVFDDNLAMFFQKGKI